MQNCKYYGGCVSSISFPKAMAKYLCFFANFYKNYLYFLKIDTWKRRKNLIFDELIFNDKRNGRKVVN